MAVAAVTRISVIGAFQATGSTGASNCLKLAAGEALSGLPSIEHRVKGKPMGSRSLAESVQYFR